LQEIKGAETRKIFRETNVVFRFREKNAKLLAIIDRRMNSFKEEVTPASRRHTEKCHEDVEKTADEIIQGGQRRKAKQLKTEMGRT